MAMESHPSLLEDRSCPGLFEIASPELYRRNAFRVLGLPVDATMGDIRRRQNRLKMMEKLGMSAPKDTGGYLPLDVPPDEDDVRRAMQRLQDPEARLLDELFWFWPQELGSSDDEGLKLLAENRVSKAHSLWRKYERDGSSGKVSTHNLAVFYHALALDLEHQAATKRLNSKGLETRADCWRRAYERWKKLLSDETFWSRLTARIRELDDPRLTTGLARRIRDSLEEAILLINARMAVTSAERGKKREAKRHATIMLKFELRKPLIRRAIRESFSPIRQRIKMLCESAKAKAEQTPKLADRASWSLLNEAKPLLAAMRLLLPKPDPMRQGAHDEVALQALRCQVAFSRETQDWQKSLILLEMALPLASSASIRKRLGDNVKIVQDNLKGTMCYFCEQTPADDDAGVEVEMYGNVLRLPVGFNQIRVTWQKCTVRVPRCRECRKNHGSIETKVAILGLGGAVLGAMGFLAGWYVGILGLLAGIGVGCVTGHWIGRSEVPYEIKFEEQKTGFHAVERLKREGWELGSGPSTT